MIATNNILDSIIEELHTSSKYFVDDIIEGQPIEDAIQTFEGYICRVDNKNVCVKMHSSITKETICASIAKKEFEHRINQEHCELNTEFSWLFYNDYDEIKIVQPIQSNILGDYSDYINRRLEEVLRQNEQENENR